MAETMIANDSKRGDDIAGLARKALSGVASEPAQGK